MDIMTIITSGTTGLIAACLLVFIITNLVKVGKFGRISRWVIDAKPAKNVYGSRILTVTIITSIIINFIQCLALGSTGEIVSVWTLLLRIIISAILATGGYEYVDTVVKNLPKKNESGE